MSDLKPTLLPLGDCAILLRFGESLSESANLSAIHTAKVLRSANLQGVTQVVANLTSVSLHYDPFSTDYDGLTGQVRLALGTQNKIDLTPKPHELRVTFGGEDGPDLAEVAAALNISEQEFIRAHNKSPLRVLATGFAPGFVYCGMHPEHLALPRRAKVRTNVPPGSVLFAAGQTAITATTIPTGWHVIGRTNFNNFDVDRDPPTKLSAGDAIHFEVAT